MQRSVDDRLERLGKRGIDARTVLNYLYKRPVITVSLVADIIGKSAPTAYSLIADLEKADILQEVTGAQRNKLYIFREYLDLFNKDS